MKITEEQQRGLDQLHARSKGARAGKAARREDIRAQAKTDLEDYMEPIEAPLRAMAWLLYEGGVPASQIGAALHITQHADYKAFILSGENEEPVEPTEETNENEIRVTTDTPTKRVLEVENWDHWTYHESRGTHSGSATFLFLDGDWFLSADEYDSQVAVMINRELFDSETDNPFKDTLEW